MNGVEKEIMCTLVQAGQQQQQIERKRKEQRNKHVTNLKKKGLP
jgi:hypothetical protein